MRCGKEKKEGDREGEREGPEERMKEKTTQHAHLECKMINILLGTCYRAAIQMTAVNDAEISKVEGMTADQVTTEFARAIITNWVSIQK